ncbi:unnamed protein product [Peronospora destructor]|uniref:rRNA methyltransferase 1, mitochondrial n=1 Tax=Peronospora destructor TaxID=86335 RepID=A0AAV0V726_9STRA|nr:unnamed protein product [Peronospora destructor]
MLRTVLHSSVAPSALSRSSGVITFVHDAVSTMLWSSSLRFKSVKSARWRPLKERGGGRWRDDRRPPLTRTNDGKDVPQLAGEGVYGIHSVLQVLESGHRDTHALYVKEERLPSDGQYSQKKKVANVQTLERIKDLAKINGVEIYMTSKWMLNHITRDKPHQGVVLDAASIRLKEFVPVTPSVFTKTRRSPVILVLDEIHDPQNLGAILRSAHFLGCTAVVVSDQNSAPLSPAVSRASVGALEVLVANGKLRKTRNLHQILAVSGDLGWRVVGASSGANSITSSKLSDGAQPTILVMGNEHCGLRKGIRQCCQDIVTIPGQATDDDTHVDSLNVSVASAILLYELLR